MNGNGLANTPLFQGLSKNEIKILTDFLVEKDYAFGDKIFKKNTLGFGGGTFIKGISFSQVGSGQNLEGDYRLHLYYKRNYNLLPTYL